MSVSTDGILVYGICVEDETLSDFDEAKYPKGDPQPGSPDFVSWMVYDGKPHDDVTLVRHCSDSAPMYILAIDGTEVTAWRGHPKLIDPASLRVDRAWESKLRAFAEKHSVQLTGEAGWWLASYWG